MKPEMIAEKFEKGFDCSQVIMEHYADELHISPETANRVAACFGGGMNRGETCGAVIGALMVLGMRYGQYDEKHMEQKDVMALRRTAFFEKFEEKYPSCICRELLGYDVSKPEDLQKILDKGLLFDFCPKVVADVIEILDAL